jgi:hypothetical protein
MGRRRVRERIHRQDIEATDRRRALALSAIDGAIMAGCALRAPGGGALDILAPVDLAAEVRSSIVRALMENKRLVISILEAADDGGGKAQTWRVPRRRGAPS